MDSFSEILKRLRGKADLSQYALAKATGLSKQTLSQLEMGNREPSWATVQKLARALGVDCRAFQEDQRPAPVKKRAKR